MSSSVRLTFLSLGLLLVLFPLTLAKPGMPMVLKADEPAYYLMALSLVHDHDLKCELKDIQRLAVEFPYNDTRNLILASDDGWKTVYFGKPYLVSLLVAPAVAAFGADGFIAANLAMLLLAVWLGALYLRQYNPDGLSLLYSAGFFLLSNAFAYAFWLHTEVLCLTSVTVCLYLAFTPGSEAPPRSRRGALWRHVWNGGTRPAFSGAVLMAAAYNKPVLALLGLPALWIFWRRRGLAGAASWIGGAVVGGVALCAVSVALIGHPSAYLGLSRTGVNVAEFDSMPALPVPDVAAGKATGVTATEAAQNSWSWIFSAFQLNRSFPPNVLYFLVGRHTGLLLYAPFVGISLLLFLAFARRSAERWLLLACLAGVACFFLTFIWFNWHGGGGFIGNRYFVNAVPGFLFLVTRIRPPAVTLVGYALGGLFVGAILFTPFGAMVPNPTLQAHTRNSPLRFFPFERTLERGIPGYRGTAGPAGTWLFGRSDLFHPNGDALWIAGGEPVDIELRTDKPLRDPVFEVSTRVAPDRVSVALDGDRRVIEFTSGSPPGNATRLTLHPGGGTSHTSVDGDSYLAYTLEVRASRQDWIVQNQRTNGQDNQIATLVGAIVVYLGEADELAADVYRVDWNGLTVPATMPADSQIEIPARLRNASAGIWRATGGAAVSFSYHWIDAAGKTVVQDGLRSHLRDDVPPGRTTALELEIETPARPGTYVLVLDGVRERIAWFADRHPGQALVRTVRVVAPGG